jgi:hypothetical protein
VPIPGREQVIQLRVAVSSGAGVGAITNQWALCRRVRVIPPNETATYTMNLKDADGHYVMKQSNVTGTLSWIDDLSLGEISTAAISGSSVDGTFIFKFSMH